jgi:hypothetical protein
MTGGFGLGFGTVFGGTTFIVVVAVLVAIVMGDEVAVDSRVAGVTTVSTVVFVV